MSQTDDSLYRFSMVGYLIENTLTENGHVARGVCRSENDFLTNVEERLRIEKHDGRIEYTEDDGSSWKGIAEGTLVSMNLWGFTAGFFTELERRFPAFLDEALKENPLKGEFLLPRVVNDLLLEKRATVKVLRSKDKWYGVTYKEDLEAVKTAIQGLQNSGLYPEKLY